MKFTSVFAFAWALALCALSANAARQQASGWTFICRDSNCERILASDPEAVNGVPMDVCKLNCHSEGSLLPLPTGPIFIAKSLTPIYPSKVTFSGFASYPIPLQELFNGAVDIFKGYFEKMAPGFNPTTGPHENNSLAVSFSISDTPANPMFSLGTDESYNLTLTVGVDNRMVAEIRAVTYFGARHGLETLSQLIAFDPVQQAFQVVNTASIQDAPVYKYRGVHLDTSRNYFSVASIKRLIDGLSYSKLNIFHWHLTDTHSFPMQVRNRPKFTEYGAYAPDKVYTLTDMTELVKYALVRGVKILPEFDEPAHTGFGWEFGPEEGLGNLTVCVNQQPWYDYCVEPPCGQLNLVNDNMYEVLGEIFSSMLSVFDNDLFHMGGDEVDLRCYNSTPEITTWMAQNGYQTDQAGFISLWSRFQDMAHEKLLAASSNPNIQSILWTSELTVIENALEYLQPEKYIIQLWTDAQNQQIPDLINNNFRVIFSNYDALYLDCGFQSWIGNGHNWCSPYKGWQTIYENSPYKIYENMSDSTSADEAFRDGRLMGGEVLLWTEQADEYASESRIWPRASALAERLWTNPTERTWEQAEFRMVTTRQRYVTRGIAADRLQPEFCSAYQNNCYGYPEDKKVVPLPQNNASGAPSSRNFPTFVPISILIWIFLLSG